MQLQTQDVDTVRALLGKACAQVSTDLNLSETQRQSLEERCDGVVSILLKPATPDREPGPSKDTEGPNTGLPLTTTSEPDIAELVQKVSAAAQRVRELRAQVPVAVTRAAQQQLAEQRPAMSGVRAAQEAAAQAQDLFVPGALSNQAQPGASGGASGELPWASECDRLREQLARIMDQLPAVRSGLEQCEQRLRVNIMAVESERSAPTPRSANKQTTPKAAAGAAGPDAAAFAARPLVARSPPPAMAALSSHGP